jgi:hypothetical protein
MRYRIYGLAQSSAPSTPHCRRLGTSATYPASARGAGRSSRDAFQVLRTWALPNFLLLPNSSGHDVGPGWICSEDGTGRTLAPAEGPR